MTMPNAESRERSSSSRWSALLTALVFFLAGLGVGWLFTSEPPAEPENLAAVGEQTTTTIPAGTTSEVGSQEDGESGSADDPVDPPDDEPIAEVAEALLPSVVQIELPFRGVGSGVIYTSDGKIITAAHVVRGVEEVSVRLADGTRIPGQVLGADPGNDIAVIQVDHTGLPAAPLALEEDPRVGQQAVALGSPWGLEATVTAGIVSAVNQTIEGPDGLPRAMLQTDAAINPGNSGGPLVDIRGRVIGINVSIFTTSGSSAGVGFAVPIHRAYRVAQAVVEKGAFVPGFLGVSVEGSPTGRAGAVIASIQPDSAAEATDLQVGDIVTMVEDVPIADPTDLAGQIRSYEAGDTVTLQLERDGEMVTVEVTLGRRPEGPS